MIKPKPRNIIKNDNSMHDFKRAKLATGRAISGGESESVSDIPRHLYTQQSSLMSYFMNPSMNHIVFNSEQIVTFGLREAYDNITQVLSHCFRQNIFTSTSRLLLIRRLEELRNQIGVNNREVHLGLFQVIKTVDSSINLYRKNIDLYLNSSVAMDAPQQAGMLHNICDILAHHCNSITTLLGCLKVRMGRKRKNN